MFKPAAQVSLKTHTFTHSNTDPSAILITGAGLRVSRAFLFLLLSFFSLAVHIILSFLFVAGANLQETAQSALWDGTKDAFIPYLCVCVCVNGRERAACMHAPSCRFDTRRRRCECRGGFCGAALGGISTTRRQTEEVCLLVARPLPHLRAARRAAALLEEECE